MKKSVVGNQEGRQMFTLVFEDCSSVGGLLTTYCVTVLKLWKSTLLLYRCSSGCFHIVTARPQRSVYLSSVSRHSPVFGSSVGGLFTTYCVTVLRLWKSTAHPQRSVCPVFRVILPCLCLVRSVFSYSRRVCFDTRRLYMCSKFMINFFAHSI